MRFVPPSIFLCLLILLVQAHASPNQIQPPPPDEGLFHRLEVGQTVSLIDLGTAYELRVPEDGIPSGKIISAIGQNWITIRDEPGTIERTIPTTSIKVITRTN